MSGAISNSGFLQTDSLDFQSLKQNFLTFLQGQPIFSGYNFTGQNMNILLDILVKNTLLNAYYLNMTGSEMFLDSAQQRDSVVSRAKELNYIPRSYTCSSAFVNLNVAVTDNTINVLTIPSGFQFSGSANNLSYTFQTIAPITLYRSNGNFIASNVQIYEGFNVTELFTVTDGANNQTFVLSNQGIDTTTLNVSVQNSITDQTNTMFIEADTLFGLNGNSAVYFLEGSFNNQYQILFGDGIFGQALVNGNIVYANYLVSSATAPNGINLFQPTATINNFNVIATTTANAAAGDIAESNQSVKFNAPRFYRAQGRAVNAADYKALILNEFSFIRTINVFGGETITSAPVYGKVYITAGTIDGSIISSQMQTDILNFVSNNSILTVVPEWIDAEYLYIVLNSTVNYNVNLTTLAAGDIQVAVLNNINAYSSNTLNLFNAPFRYSKFLATIDSSDPSIVGNETSIQLMKEISPVINQPQTFTIDFGNAFQQYAQDDVSYPAITSSNLTINNILCNISDDGNGILNAYQITPTGRSIVQSAIGTVDYGQGIVNLINLYVQDYSNNVSIFAVPLNTDVIPVRNNIITIDTDISTVNVIGVTQ